MLGAVRGARAGQGCSIRLGELQVQAVPGRVILRLNGSSATFEGATLERLERLLENWGSARG